MHAATRRGPPTAHPASLHTPTGEPTITVVAHPSAPVSHSEMAERQAAVDTVVERVAPTGLRAVFTAAKALRLQAVDKLTSLRDLWSEGYNALVVEAYLRPRATWRLAALGLTGPALDALRCAMSTTGTSAAAALIEDTLTEAVALEAAAVLLPPEQGGGSGSMSEATARSLTVPLLRRGDTAGAPPRVTLGHLADLAAKAGARPRSRRDALRLLAVKHAAASRAAAAGASCKAAALAQFKARWTEAGALEAAAVLFGLAAPRSGGGGMTAAQARALDAIVLWPGDVAPAPAPVTFGDLRYLVTLSGAARPDSPAAALELMAAAHVALSRSYRSRVAARTRRAARRAAGLAYKKKTEEWRAAARDIAPTCSPDDVELTDEEPDNANAGNGYRFFNSEMQR